MPITNQPITLSRETDVVEIPSGVNNKLPAGTVVRVMQNLGTTYTVYSDYGLMYRIDAKDADALGLSDGLPRPNRPFASERTLQRKDGVGSIEDRLRSGDSGEHRRSGADLFLPDQEPRPGRASHRYRNDSYRSRLRHGQRAQVRCRNQAGQTSYRSRSPRRSRARSAWGPARMSEAARLQLGLDL